MLLSKQDNTAKIKLFDTFFFICHEQRGLELNFCKMLIVVDLFGNPGGGWG